MPSLSGDLGSTYGATHDPQQAAPCAMWEAGAGCCGSIGMPCQAFHDPELMCLNTCETSKAVCQGFGCFRVVDNGPHHHDLWMMDVNYFMYEPLKPAKSSEDEEASDGDDNEKDYVDGHCWLSALVQDVEAAAKTPLDDTGLRQTKWFLQQLEGCIPSSHMSAAGPGFAPLMLHIAQLELGPGPDFSSDDHHRMFARNRQEPIRFLDTPCDLRRSWAGTNKFRVVYQKSSSSTGAASP